MLTAHCDKCNKPFQFDPDAVSFEMRVQESSGRKSEITHYYPTCAYCGTQFRVPVPKATP